jgi:hypothetical protein
VRERRYGAGSELPTAIQGALAETDEAPEPEDAEGPQSEAEPVEAEPVEDESTEAEAEEPTAEEAASDEDEAWISADTAEEAEAALPAESPSEPEE